MSLQHNNSLKCPCCDGEASYTFSAKDWNQQTSDKDFKYFLCDNCKLTFIENIPENLDQFYINEQYNIPDSLRTFLPRAHSQAWKVDILKSFIVDGALLEIGPATGEFAYMARQAGFKPKLLEMDKNCCNFLREVLELDVTQTNNPMEYLAANPSIVNGNQFDVICIWQAIEHIPQFWRLLNSAVACLNSGGVLAVSTPNPMSFQAQTLGRRWPHIDAPRHLYLIPQDWFVSFAHRHNLSVVLKTTRDVGSLGLNYYGWYLAVRNFFPRMVSDSWIQSIARWIGGWAQQREEAEGGGCSYTVVFRRLQEIC